MIWYKDTTVLLALTKACGLLNMYIYTCHVSVAVYGIRIHRKLMRSRLQLDNYEYVEAHVTNNSA